MGETASRIPEFVYDPADMPALRSKLRHLPESETFPDFELTRTEIGEDALLKLPGILEELAGAPGAVIVVEDDVPFIRGSDSVKPFVAALLAGAGWEVETIVLPDAEDGKPHADQETVDLVLGRLRPGVPVVSVGSGTVTDVAKHACFLFAQEQEHEPLPLVFCATANSMLAYSARMAVILKDGVKRTWPSRLSDALIHDTAVLRDAPPPHRAGGDR